MDGNQRLTIGLLLTFAAIIWLFLVSIWMPPLTIVAILIGIKIALPQSFYGRWLLYLEVTMASCTLGYGIYLVFRSRTTVSR